MRQRTPAELEQRLRTRTLTTADFVGVALEEAEELIRRQPIEHALVLSSGQVTLYHTAGRPHELPFTEAETSGLRDATLTHNHPTGASLSAADVALALRQDLAEMRATAAHGTFVVRRLDSGFRSRDVRAFLRDYRRVLAEEIERGRALVRAGGMGRQAVELFVSERVWMRLGILYGFTYEYRARRS